jgi:hypothetical protein
VLGLRVAERDEPRAGPLAPVVVDRVDQTLAGQVLAGGFERLHQRVGVGHPVLDVAVERRLGSYLAVDLHEQLIHGFELSLNDGR